MSHVEQIQLSLEQAMAHVERKRQAEKLASNREFKKLVLEGYFEQEAIRLVSLSAEPGLSETQRAAVMLEIQSISIFQQYLRTIIQLGMAAENSIEDHEEALAEARAQEAETN